MIYQYGPEQGRAQGTGRLVFDGRNLTVSWLTGKPPAEVQAVWELAKAHQSLTSALLSDASGQMAPDDFGKQSASAAVAAFVLDFLDVGQDRPCPWDGVRFARLFRRFSESLAAAMVTRITWGPVDHLEWTDTRSRALLADRLSLVEPDLATQIHLAPTFLLDAPSPGLRGQHRYYLRAESRVKIKEPMAAGDDDRISRAILGIRLLVGGEATVSQRRLEILPGQVKTFGVPHGYFHGWPRFYPFGQHSALSAADIRPIRHLISGIPKLHELFPIALDRYQLVPERERPHDKLIDAVVGLESLLLPNTQDELRFRFALRGARLLGRTSVDRKTWFDRLSKLYKARSEIVHGNPARIAQVEPSTATEAVDALRLALVAAHNRGMSAKNLARTLDAELLA